MYNTRKILRSVGIALFVLVIVSYAYTHTRNVFLGPSLTFENPVSGTTVQEPLFELHGTAIRTSTLDINDAQALIEEDGSFRSSLLLSTGYNIIEIVAVDKFGRESVNHIEIIYKPIT